MRQKRGNRRPHTIECAGRRLTWRESDLTWELRGGETVWHSDRPPVDAVQTAGKRVLAIPLSAARSVETTRLSSGATAGFACRLADFAGLPARARLELILTLALEEASGDLIVGVDGRAANMTLGALYWPGPVRTDRATTTVAPLYQGVLIPGAWPSQIPTREFRCTGKLYMPWWGYLRGRDGCMVRIETPDDAGCRATHPAGGPTRMTPRWDAGLGDVAYPRRMRYSFMRNAGYVAMCKRYRRSVQREGRFISLREKAAQAPKILDLAGAAVVHMKTVVHMHPPSDYYNKENPANNDICHTFAERSEQLRRLRSKGLSRAYIHVDGWGVQGYDRAHPDILPPSREAGGWKGLRALVYHDSMMTPWPEEETEAVAGPVAAALHGGMPYVDIEASRSRIRAARRVCRLHRRVAFEEMVDHELLDPEGRRQRSVFADGTTVTADLAAGEWESTG
jgi:hypothetical protein